MIVTIHQPSYLPWIPFLEKGLRSDVFVLLDDVQFEKNSATNRNRIKTAQGATWLTVPVSRNSHTPICGVQIPAAQRGFFRKHRRTIEENYRKSPYFEIVADPLFDLLDRECSSLLDLNLQINRLWLKMAGYRGRVMLASQIDAGGTNWQRVLGICRTLGADTYLSGSSGADYLNLAAFDDAGIRVLFQHCRYVEYPQQFPKVGFVPRLSALDLMMNVGVAAECRRLILSYCEWRDRDGHIT
ncbi:MAG TPA: WbqC family protein [Thermoguttaceae bacterium]|nr:WbqC family protein [Thermoguttaceae bacterium]